MVTPQTCGILTRNELMGYFIISVFNTDPSLIRTRTRELNRFLMGGVSSKVWSVRGTTHGAEPGQNQNVTELNKSSEGIQTEADLNF